MRGKGLPSLWYWVVELAEPHLSNTCREQVTANSAGRALLPISRLEKQQ